MGIQFVNLKAREKLTNFTRTAMIIYKSMTRYSSLVRRPRMRSLRRGARSILTTVTGIKGTTQVVRLAEKGRSLPSAERTKESRL